MEKSSTHKTSTNDRYEVTICELEIQAGQSSIEFPRNICVYTSVQKFNPQKKYYRAYLYVVIKSTNTIKIFIFFSVKVLINRGKEIINCTLYKIAPTSKRSHRKMLIFFFPKLCRSAKTSIVNYQLL